MAVLLGRHVRRDNYAFLDDIINGTLKNTLYRDTNCTKNCYLRFTLICSLAVAIFATKKGDC